MSKDAEKAILWENPEGDLIAAILQLQREIGYIYKVLRQPKKITFTLPTHNPNIVAIHEGTIE